MAKIDVNVPDIGDFKDVPVIEVLVKPGDTVKVDQSLVTLESDKATMDVPSPVAGKVADVVAKVGDKVSMGVLIARIDAEGAGSGAPRPPRRKPSPRRPRLSRPLQRPPRRRLLPRLLLRPPAPGPAKPDFSGVFAGPAVRRLARELDLDLNTIKGTGEHGRITREDVKAALAGGRGSGRGRRRRRCRPFPRSTSPSSVRSRPCRCRASSASPGRACTPPGSTCRTSPIRTKPTSPTSRPSARRSTRTRRKTRRSPTACRCCRS